MICTNDKAMSDSIIIKPMNEQFILWRCLHGGVINRQNIDSPNNDIQLNWQDIKLRNLSFLKSLIFTYGSCALLAFDGDSVIAAIRFYPKFLCRFSDSGTGFCLQQSFTSILFTENIKQYLLPVEKLKDKTLFIHCMFIASSRETSYKYRRKGLATNMVQDLIKWAQSKGWEAIEVDAYEGLPTIYAISGSAGKDFWGKLNFEIINTATEPAINGDFLETLKKEAVSLGKPVENVVNRYRMRIELP